MKRRILSGVQPTGHLHLGNYLGALRNWVSLQDQKEYECLYCVVDLHAITMPYDPKALRQSVRETTAAFIACGIDPGQSIIFNQSAVPQHAELGWLFSCLTPMGWLNRMTQFKEKAGKKREQAGLGLFAYPVLMAADILVYRSTHVPVGEDQKQHLELARNIAGAFNRVFGEDYFPLPEPQILGHASRVMSLRDGTKKMSKSDPSDYSRIHLTDTPEQIIQKIRKAKTDPDALPESPAELETRPEAKNLLVIHSAVLDQPLKKSLDSFAGKSFSDLKTELSDVVVSHLAPISAKMNELLNDPGEIDRILKDGADKAIEIARPTLEQVHKLMGLA